MGKVADKRRLEAELAALRRQRFFFYGLLALAIFVRVILFGTHPGGLNQDEASLGYDAWALLHYGVDRNGFSWPVHLMAWGSGQNALYAYLSIPFIALFGLNAISVRLVNLIFALLAIVAIHGVVNRLYGRRAALTAMALAAISPWHIMLSRWGLESNLFPQMLILALWTMVYSLDRPWLLAISSGLFALSLYSYGSAYLVVSMLFFACLFYIWFKRLVSRRWCVAAAAIYIAIGLPIYLFLAVNLFHLGDRFIGPFAIPQLHGDRMVSMMAGLSPRVVLRNLWRLLILQYDGATRNGFSGYGCLYVISIPFWVLGIVRIFQDKRAEAFFLRAFFVCPLFLFVIYAQPNINRVNAVYLPLILLTGVGLADICRKRKQVVALAAVYALLFGGFCTRYFRPSYREEIAAEFYDTFGKAIVYANGLARQGDTVYVTRHVNMPYIYVLFYTGISPQEYQETAIIPEKEQQFQWVEALGGPVRYVFDTDDILYEPGIYVVDNREVVPELKGCEIQEFALYSVVIVEEPVHSGNRE